MPCISLAWIAGPGIIIKRYQLLRELAPHAARVGTLLAPNTMYDVAGHLVDLKRLKRKILEVTNKMGLESGGFYVQKLADFKPEFAAITKWEANSLIVLDEPLTLLARKQIVAFARRHRLVDVYEARGWSAS